MRRIVTSFFVGLSLLAVVCGVPLYSQYRQIDQGNKGVQAWLITICDPTGTLCGTYTVPVSVTGTITVTGTVQNNGGTVTATPTGTTTITGTVTATSGTINSMPSVSVTSGTIGSLPAVSVTSATIGSITTGTVQANAGTGTIGVDLAKFLGAALTTANPVITGARGSTTVPSAVADAAVVAQRLSKYGESVIVFAPPDLESTGTIKPTTTASTQIIATSGATTAKWKITSIVACNLSGTIATEMDITDSTNTVDSFVWSATAVAGEPRCIQHAFPDGYPTVANSSISGKLTVSDASGVFVAIKANKTGT